MAILTGCRRDLKEEESRAMGTWGPGNFDDDVARDYLSDVIGRFEQFIERILAGDIPQEAMGMDNVLDAGEHCLLPAVEMISVLHEVLASDYLPRPETVTRWAEQVEPLLEKLDPVAYQQWYIPKRRPVVAATFERLSQHCRARYNSTQVPAPDP